MPNRIIKQSAFESEKISAISDFDFRVWVGLITQADDAGRGDARPAILKGRIFPLRERVTVKDIDQALVRLAAAGCVSLYTVGGKPYYAFPNWAKHQRVYNTKTKHPGPEEADEGAMSAVVSGHYGESAEDCGSSRQPAAIRGFNPNPNPNINPNPNPETNARGRADDAFKIGFDEFWDAYPRKVGKKDAYKAFCKAIKAIGVDAMIEAIDRQKRSEQWTKEGGRYIPNPATWLNQGRWEDELPAGGGPFQRHGDDVSPMMRSAVDRMMEEE